MNLAIASHFPADTLPAAVVRLAALASSSDVAAGDGHIRWRRFGEGKPLVLIHGGHGSWLHWVRNIEAWMPGHTVWVVDLPGYGDSDNPCRPDLDSLVDATVRSLNDIVSADRGIDMVGFSFGGLVAAHVAARLGCVEKLVLLGPVGHATPRRPKGEMVGWKNAKEVEELAIRMRHNLAVQMFHDEAHIDALALWIHTFSSLRTRFYSRPFSRSNSLFEAIDRHQGKLLLVWGEHDVTAEPAVLASALVAGNPKRQASIVANSGHWVQYESADAINRLLLDWMTEGNTPAAVAAPLNSTREPT